MIGAISSSTSAAAKPTAAPAPRAPLTLDAQLTRAQTELSDCVNCDSAKTPAGQKQIAEISSKINAIKQQMAQASGGAASASLARAPSAPSSGNILDTYA